MGEPVQQPEVRLSRPGWRELFLNKEVRPTGSLPTVSRAARVTAFLNVLEQARFGRGKHSAK